MRAAQVAMVATVSVGIAAAVAAPPRTAAPPAPAARIDTRPNVEPRELRGWRTYDRFCLACHGANGDGKGPAAAFAWGDPRDFARGAYEWRSTPWGQPPTDNDLRAAILFGATGTSMPGFEGILSDNDIADLLEVIKAFSPATFARLPVPVVLGPPVPPNAERGAHLWTQHGCDKCHGSDGRGDVTGLAEKPYDLTRFPLRRPRDGDDLASRRSAAMMSIATGLTGTPMPGFAGPVTEPELWALADHVLALGARAKRSDHSALDDDRIERDRTTKLALGAWPGNDVDEARVFGTPLHEQGAPPKELAPAQASLRERQCARCHAKQAREWTGSVHSRAATWGLPVREADHAGGGDSACSRCHTPLAEQQPSSTGFDASLRDEGVTCAGCHVRDWIRRGPPRIPSSTLMPAPGYPLVELALYERSDFCMGCHQLPPRTAVAGKPLLNTYKEWLEGPYMRRGIQCQHCHMPNREHTWLGIHDKETFRQGIRLDASARRKDSSITVSATLVNIGAGHYLPTTPTPAVTLRIELLDKAGAALPGARAELRIGRDVESTQDGWREHDDSRIPPGESRTLLRAWTTGTASAAFARILVEVAPDAFYEKLYAQRAASNLPAETRRAYEAALARTRRSRYVAEQTTIPITSPSMASPTR